MIEIAKLDRGIALVGSPYLLCVLAAQRVKQLHGKYPHTRSSVISFFKTAVNEIITGDLNVFLQNGLTRFLSNFPDSDLGHSTDQSLMSLFALAKPELEEEGWVYVGQEYAIRVGISSEQHNDFEAYPFTLSIQQPVKMVPFDFLIHLTGNLQLVGDWHKRLFYAPSNIEPQLIDFHFKVIDTGPNQVKIDCYHEQRWLRTIQFSFDAVEMQLLEVAVA